MVFFNHATRQMTAKIVYYGPGLCGKTTNLNTIYGKTSQKARGEMVSLNTETDRTLFFDLLPMDVGMVGGFKTKLQLYTVPGQVFYNSTRKLVLKGVDGIVFVVDSQRPMLDACKESYQNLEANLRELGLNLGDIPMVYQWNKRDLRSVVPVDELEAVFNPRGFPSFQSVASDGAGVFETLRGITKLSLTHIKVHVLGEANQASSPPVSHATRPAGPLAARHALPPPASPGAPPKAQVHSALLPPAPPPAPPQTPSAIQALTLSDLPSVTDLLDMEGSAAAGVAAGSSPLPDDDDDSGFFIEAPLLPEPPEVAPDEITFLTTESNDAPPPVGPAGEGLPRPVAGDPGSAKPEAPLPPAPAVAPVVAGTEAPAALVSAEVHLPPMDVTPPSVQSHQPTFQPLHPPAVRVDPLAALASLKLDAIRPAAKPKPVDHQGAINSLMGELTQVGRAGAPSVLRLEIPQEVDGQEIEVVVQLRRQGQVLVEGKIQRPAPGKGITAKLSVEMKRS
jgi:signal recognition particle receptor subunit beta